MWWHLDGWGAVRPRRREGEWGEGPSLAITARIFWFTYAFRLSASVSKVASKYPFCVLICMNSHIFHIHFILFIFLSNTYLIFNFHMLDMPTHMDLIAVTTRGKSGQIRIHIHTKIKTQKEKEVGKKEKKGARGRKEEKKRAKEKKQEKEKERQEKPGKRKRGGGGFRR